MHKTEIIFKEREHSRDRTCGAINGKNCRVGNRKSYYWLIRLYWCVFKKCPQGLEPAEAAMRTLNHEIMHGILYEIDGQEAYEGWDDKIRTRSKEKGKGWWMKVRGRWIRGEKMRVCDIVAKYLPEVYCDEGGFGTKFLVILQL